jgi:hypothetical protein
MTAGSGQELPITRDALLDVHLAQAKDTHRARSPSSAFRLVNTE